MDNLNITDRAIRALWDMEPTDAEIEMLEAIGYEYSPVWVGGRGWIGYLYPPRSLPGAPCFRRTSHGWIPE